MKKISLLLIAVAALTARASAQDLGWNTDGGAAFVRSLRAVAAQTRAAAVAPRLEATPLPGAYYSDDASANAAHTLTLSFRRTCGASAAAACAPYCANGVCAYDYPITASVETSEGELGRYVADMNFVFPQLTVEDGRVLQGGDLVGAVDPLTKQVVLANGWQAHFVVTPAADPNTRAGSDFCRARGDCPGSDPTYAVSVYLEKK